MAYGGSSLNAPPTSSCLEVKGRAALWGMAHGPMLWNMATCVGESRKGVGRHTTLPTPTGRAFGMDAWGGLQPRP